MDPSREDIFLALYAQFQTLEAPNGPFRTVTRRMMEYSSIPPALLPILVLWEQPERTTYNRHQGLPYNELEAVAVVVFRNESKPRNDDPTTAIAGATIINPLIDAVRGVLAPDDISTNNFTLGGLVEWCRVEGRTIVESGDTDADGRGGAVIPIKIVIPSQGDL